MRRVTYKSVLDRIAGYLGQSEGLSVEDAAIANQKINLFTRLAWEHYWWPELMRVEERTFRQVYVDSVVYRTGDEVWYPPAKAYYLCLADTSYTAPATLSGGSYQATLPYWTECQVSWEGDDHVSTRDDYTMGEVVRNPADSLFYMCFGATNGLTLSGSTVTALNTFFLELGVSEGRKVYSDASTALEVIFWTGSAWRITTNTLVVIFESSDDVSTPDLVTTWIGQGIYAGETPPTIVEDTQQLAPPSAQWGLLVPFVRSIDYEQTFKATLGTTTSQTPLGEVRFIWDSDPRTFQAARRAGGGRGPDFLLREDYIQVLGAANTVWLEFRIRPSSFSGATRSDSLPYAAGVTLYDTATGDYWTSLESISAGESPTVAPSSWSRVDFPYIFAEYVAQSAYAAMTNREQETPENFAVQISAGYPLLLAELNKIERQQGQTRQLNVVLSR